MSQIPMFRESFQHASKELLHWFPGHMAKGLRVMQQKLRSMDGIIEVHDARIPFSGRNPLFEDRLASVRPHLFVLNKIDLADMSRKDEIVSRLKYEGVTEVILTNLKNGQDKASKEIVSKMIDMIKSGTRFDRAMTSPSSYNLLVIGIPNVGKSSLINRIRTVHTKREGKAAPVGAEPGVTRAVQQGILVNIKPKVYILDSPGIAQPRVNNVVEGMKLALCNIIHDHKVGIDIVADFLLFYMNKAADFRYVKAFNLDNPTDKIMEVLVKIAVDQNIYHKVKPVTGGPWMEKLNLEQAAYFMVRKFRSGELGKICLDSDQLPTHTTATLSRQRARSR
ncbi:hypothetical protein RvY_03458 [Ramazzottius varieornatus]|uniref:Mitochondrial GTPase 1 n=1 Tax=Ramazzottius varieornatus TaxID=947166 RepID=A0A1D1UN66_RAMVA|nr:hypothetical protein RvY_03458 [Ramazzottius varieornatus]